MVVVVVVVKKIMCIWGSMDNPHIYHQVYIYVIWGFDFLLCFDFCLWGLLFHNLMIFSNLWVLIVTLEASLREI